MKSVDNPYSPGAGTPPPELAGRESLPEQITQQLHRILLRLDRRERVKEKVQRAFVLLRGFASAFRVKFGEFEVGLSGDVATGDLNIDLTDLLVAVGEAAESRNTVAVMMVDEVQYIAKRDLGAQIMALHKISQRQLPVIFFGTGLPQLARLAGEASGRVSLPDHQGGDPERGGNITDVLQLRDRLVQATVGSCSGETGQNHLRGISAPGARPLQVRHLSQRGELGHAKEEGQCCRLLRSVL